jgi:hypothetical protein
MSHGGTTPVAPVRYVKLWVLARSFVLFYLFWRKDELHSLLATKLYIPTNRPELVSRRRLIKRLNAGLPTREVFPARPLSGSLAKAC